MTWMAGLRRRMWLTAAASLLAALAALALALVAASDGSRASRQLSGRLLPAAAQAGALAADYTAQRAALRDYAVDRQPQALRAYRETSTRIPAMVQALSALVEGEGPVLSRFTATQAAHAA